MPFAYPVLCHIPLDLRLFLKGSILIIVWTSKSRDIKQLSEGIFLSGEDKYDKDSEKIESARRADTNILK